MNFIFPYIFPYIGNVIIPTDFHSIIFQRGRYTTNQTKSKWLRSVAYWAIQYSGYCRSDWTTPHLQFRDDLAMAYLPKIMGIWHMMHKMINLCFV